MKRTKTTDGSHDLFAQPASCSAHGPQRHRTPGVNLHISQSNRLSSIRWLGALLLFAGLLALPGSGAAQLDVCGCTGNPNSLGAFDTDNPATYPPGTVVTTGWANAY
jgi:hypothetical protein